MGKLDKWLERVSEKAAEPKAPPPPSPPSAADKQQENQEKFPAEGKLDRWLSRAKTADKPSEMPATAAAPAPSASSSESGGKIDRWLARSKTATSPTPSQDESAAHAAPAPVESKPVVSSPPSGGVSACCNLLHLLDNAELAEVFNVLVSVMSNKGISAGGAAQASSSSGGSASSSDLDVILAQIKALSADAKQRTAKASSAASAASAASASTSSSSSSPSAPVEGKSKLDRWAARAKAPAPAPAPAPVEGKSKLDRWAARAKAPASAPAPAGIAAASGAELTPIETVKQCCEAVRESWKELEANGGEGGADISEERRKLQEEKKSLDNLMQMVYAVRNTPAEVSGTTPPGSGGPPMWQNGQPSQSNGMPNGMHGGPNPVYGQPGGPPPGGMNGYGPPPGYPGAPPPGGMNGYHGGMNGGYGGPPAGYHQAPVAKPDPDALLAEFLKARREEREQETKQLVNDKKNPRKVVEGKGWRAGSPMSSAAKPTEPVRISLSRPPPQMQQQIMMMGPPPEGGGYNGTREEVMNKEGGGGFFVYPPGHPNGPPGGPPPPGGGVAFEGQLRSTVHPMERIAPRWSEAKFKAAGMPEVICESRHATFGLLCELQGRLVRCNPPDAKTQIVNVDQVRGQIVYVKRGGCSFTRKARIAQAAGAIAMVVANSDRETFGMSFTDDGEPFEAIKIPCVMISSDVCEKLESCKTSTDGRAPWTCTLTPMTDRTSPAFQQHMQLQAMAAANGGGPIQVLMPQDDSRGGHGGGSSKGKGDGIMGRLKNMLP